jgi:hypothetical protein
MTLPKLEDWLAPWETGQDGKALPDEEQKIDAPRLKKYLHGLLSDKERLQTSVTTVTEERDTLRKQVDEKAREGESEVDRLKRELAEAQAAGQRSKEESAEKRALRLEVALEKGLTKVQAARLQGETAEEMAADADALLESFGGSGKEGEGEGEEKPPTRTPRRLGNAGDPEGQEGSDIDIDKALDSIPRL